MELYLNKIGPRGCINRRVQRLRNVTTIRDDEFSRFISVLTTRVGNYLIELVKVQAARFSSCREHVRISLNYNSFRWYLPVKTTIAFGLECQIRCQFPAVLKVYYASCFRFFPLKCKAVDRNTKRDLVFASGYCFTTEIWYSYLPSRGARFYLSRYYLPPPPPPFETMRMNFTTLKITELVSPCYISYFIMDIHATY